MTETKYTERLRSHKASARDIMAECTKQDVIFPIDQTMFSSNGSRKLRLENQLFYIQDDFLYNCITYGDGLDEKRFSGFTWTKGIGYAFLAFFVQKAFNLHRFPFFPDRNLAGHLSEKQKNTVLESIKILTPKKVDAICNELIAIYEHAQKLLNEKDVTEVTLTRKINTSADCPVSRANYAQTIMTLKKAAQVVGIDKVQFEMDILNSWGDDTGYSFYPVMLCRSIPSQDILYFSNMIASRDTLGNIHRAAVEQAEWVVLNRSQTGVVDFPVDDIIFDDNVYEQSRNWSQRTYADFLENHTPFPFRYSHRIDARNPQTTSGWVFAGSGRILWLKYLIKALLSPKPRL